MKTMTYKLTLPAISATRCDIDYHTLVDHLIKLAEETNCGSVSVSYTLIKEPWEVTIEVKKQKHHN